MTYLSKIQNKLISQFIKPVQTGEPKWHRFAESQNHRFYCHSVINEWAKLEEWRKNTLPNGKLGENCACNKHLAHNLVFLFLLLHALHNSIFRIGDIIYCQAKTVFAWCVCLQDCSYQIIGLSGKSAYFSKIKRARERERDRERFKSPQYGKSFLGLRLSAQPFIYAQKLGFANTQTLFSLTDVNV